MWLHTLHLPHTPWSGTRCPSVRAPNARWRRCVVSYWKSSVPTSLALRIDGWMCVTWLHHWRNLAAFVHSKTPISTSPQLEKYAKPKWWVFQKQQISIISRSRIGALKELIYILSLTFACFGGLDSPDSPTLTVSHSESFEGTHDFVFFGLVFYRRPSFAGVFKSSFQAAASASKHPGFFPHVPRLSEDSLKLQHLIYTPEI